MLDVLRIDIRHSLRHLRRSPGFSLAAISTVALTIAANTTALSLVNATMLRSIAVFQPDRLVSIATTDTRTNRTAYIDRDTFDAFRKQQQSFSTLSMYSGGAAYRLEARGTAVDVGVEGVMPEYFDLVRARPTVGRFLTSSDSNPAQAQTPTTVITDRLWRRMFGAESRAVGETIKVEGKAVTIIGVTSPGFYGLQLDSGSDVFLPVWFARALAGDRSAAVRAPNVVGRLAPGVSLEEARAEVLARWPGLQSATLPPSERSAVKLQHVAVESLATGFSSLRRQWGPSFVALVGLTVVLLAIGCVNLMGLMSARASARRREIAICQALGASPARVCRQVVVDGLMLATFGLGAALPLAWWSSQVLTAMLTFARTIPLQRPMTPDGRVLALAISLAIVMGVLIGLLPAWRAANGRVSDSLREGRAIVSAVRRFGQLMLVIQVAFSVILLVGAGLFSGTVSSLHAKDTQFRTQDIVWTRLTRNPGDRGTVLGRPYFQGLIERLSAIPGVDSGALSYLFPANLGYRGPIPADTFELGGAASASQITGLTEFVSPGFFRTFDIPRLRGRDFTWDDDGQSPAVAIISAKLAEKLSPDGNAVGGRLRVTSGAKSTDLEIVGVVADAPMGRIRDPHPAVAFRPMMQDLSRAQFPMAHVRVSGDIKAVRDAYLRVVESQGRYFVRGLFTLTEWIDNALLQERLIAGVSTAAAALAVLLSCIGIYAALAYAVTSRVREIGVRMALGASRTLVVLMIVRDGLRVAIPGILIGIPCAVGAARLVRSQLYGVTPTDPRTILASAAVFIVTGIAAALIPALSASKIDAIQALRQD